MVIKIHETKVVLEDRLCDVQCINCGEVRYYQPYDTGKRLNVIPKKE